MTVDLLGRELIQCPNCGGSGREPTAITTFRTTCGECGGGGYFHKGSATRLATIQEYMTDNRKDASHE